ncbi:TPA: DNA adenine methylase [Escherichia coli]
MRYGSVCSGAAAMPIEEPALRSWQRPFLKWAGGKYSLLPELDRLIPAGKRLIEPFVGGGSVFLNSDKHERFLLADVNADLINLYQMLAVVPDSVIYEAMKAFRHLNDAENYTVIREAFNAQRLDAVERAAAKQSKPSPTSEQVLKAFTDAAMQKNTVEELKQAFAKAWKMLEGTPEQHKAQDVYNIRRDELEGAAA